MSEYDERLEAASRLAVEEIFKGVEAMIGQATAPLIARIRELERQVAELREKVSP